MDKTRSSDGAAEVASVLGALGGQATPGDLHAVTTLTRSQLDTALDRLLATGQAHVRVTAAGDVVYHLNTRGASPFRSLLRGHAVALERKTLRFIRACEGVVSLAELVEHTGYTLASASEEMARLVDAYGGEAHTSLDGYVVYAFPALMASTHPRFAGREPRPSWVRTADPRDRGAPGTSGAPFDSLARPRGRAARRFLRSRLRRPRWLLRRDPTTLRRWALGHVYETALAGKGVVSLDRAVRYLEARSGGRVLRRHVETALRRLATEFDAPITHEGGDLFFGFRNIKRQFLASHLVRRSLALRRTASGPTWFDSADSRAAATARDLSRFDAELARPPGEGGSGDRV